MSFMLVRELREKEIKQIAIEIFEELDGHVADDDFIDEAIYMAEDRYECDEKEIDEIIDYIEEML